MKLVGSKTSPYVRKARVILAEKQLAFEWVPENVWDAATRIGDFNPLGKVPALVTDEGDHLYDSPVIAEYLDSMGGGIRFIPAAGIERARVRRDEALGDGIADAGITVFLERKREASRQDPAWIARQLGKVEAGIAALARELGGKAYLGGEAMSLGDVACGCALFWSEFRLPELGLRAKHPAVAAWAKRLEARPSFASTRPQDA
jgi:glutathione S-transferase